MVEVYIVEGSADLQIRVYAHLVLCECMYVWFNFVLIISEEERFSPAKLRPLVGVECEAVSARMIPFTSSMLLGCRPGRYPVQSFVIIEPPVSTNLYSSKRTQHHKLFISSAPIISFNERLVYPLVLNFQMLCWVPFSHGEEVAALLSPCLLDKLEQKFILTDPNDRNWFK